VEGDALRLPFLDNTFQAITIAFGLRNLEDYTTGLREMARVLKPGGRLFVLDFSEPQIPFLRVLYRFYFQKILPKIGGWISGNHEAYSYLPASVCGYPKSKDLVRIFVDAGFCSISRIKLTGGISDIHCAVKSP
jgi:demethylmenaquinone methyltransferase/2-methoxy-6-polyprenyl-1,4-benzoquinol methylase